MEVILLIEQDNLFYQDRFDYSVTLSQALEQSYFLYHSPIAGVSIDSPNTVLHDDLVTFYDRGPGLIEYCIAFANPYVTVDRNSIRANGIHATDDPKLKIEILLRTLRKELNPQDQNLYPGIHNPAIACVNTIDIFEMKHGPFAFRCTDVINKRAFTFGQVDNIVHSNTTFDRDTHLLRTGSRLGIALNLMRRYPQSYVEYDEEVDAFNVDGNYVADIYQEKSPSSKMIQEITIRTNSLIGQLSDQYGIPLVHQEYTYDPTGSLLMAYTPYPSGNSQNGIPYYTRASGQLRKLVDMINGIQFTDFLLGSDYLFNFDELDNISRYLTMLKYQQS